MNSLPASIISALCALGLATCTPAAPESRPAPTVSATTVTVSAQPSSSGITEASTPGQSQSPSLASPSATPTLTEAKTRSQCLQFSQHQYEVCSAYLANATLAARVPFYEASRQGGDAYYRAVRENCVARTVGEAATCRLFSRYYGAARQQLLDQAAPWPPKVHVGAPRIHVDSVVSDVSQNTATLTTHETWRVTTESGKVLFEEVNQSHIISMQRIPGIFLHKWVVTGLH